MPDVKHPSANLLGGPGRLPAGQHDSESALARAIHIAWAGFDYFVLVFAVGFLLGVIRTVWIVPAIGTDMAELAETPVMLAVSFTMARWLIQTQAIPRTFRARFAMGGIALSLMVAAETIFVSSVRGMSITEYFTGRDTFANCLYGLSLLLFGLMPLFIGRKFGRILRRWGH